DEPARRTVLKAVVEAAAGRVPVICGVAQPNVQSARAEVEAAARLGANAVLVAAPFYYPMDQASVLAFYRRIADAAPVPILVYNIPQFTKVVVEPATVAALANEGAIRASQDALYRLVMALRGDVFPGAIKAALHLQGICEPWPAPPAQRLDEPHEARLSRQLAAFGLLTPERSRH